MEQFPSAGINHNYFGLLSNKKHQLLVTRTHSDYSATIRVSHGSREQYFILFSFLQFQYVQVGLLSAENDPNSSLKYLQYFKKDRRSRIILDLYFCSLSGLREMMT